MDNNYYVDLVFLVACINSCLTHLFWGLELCFSVDGRCLYSMSDLHVHSTMLEFCSPLYTFSLTLFHMTYRTRCMFFCLVLFCQMKKTQIKVVVMMLTSFNGLRIVLEGFMTEEKKFQRWQNFLQSSSPIKLQSTCHRYDFSLVELGYSRAIASVNMSLGTATTDCRMKCFLHLGSISWIEILRP